jgi:hypothetical protein
MAVNHDHRLRPLPLAGHGISSITATSARRAKHLPIAANNCWLPIRKYLAEAVATAIIRPVGSLAQLVEQRTFNPLVAGSNPARPTTNKQYEIKQQKNASLALAFFISKTTFSFSGHAPEASDASVWSAD